MTEEETIPSMMPSMAPAEDEEESAPMTDEEVAAKTQARLQKKLRVGDGEDILLTRRCSIFAFMPMYIIGFMILGIHLFFDWASAPDDATWYESVFFFLVEASGWLNGLGFAFVMLFFTWINRVINHPASGRWVTLYLIIVSITPLVINFDTLLANLPFGLGTESEFIPFGYDIATAGIVYFAIFMLLTFLYQKSFLYAVTSERIIHYQWFLYERDAHRVLHEDIVKVHTKRTPMGAVFGYNTIYCDIGDGSHLSTESVGGGVAIPGGGTTTTTNAEGEVKKGWSVFSMLRKMIFFATFQRTIKTERFTPDQSFYGIRQWEEAFDLINKLQHENSMATKQDQQLEVLMQMKDMLSNNPEAAEGEEIDDLLGDI
jgi:hypothetical protein